MSLSFISVTFPWRQELSGLGWKGRRRQMSSGHEVPRETLDELSRDTRWDWEEMHCWERKRQESRTHLRGTLGDMGRSKIQGEKVRKHSKKARSGEQNRDVAETQWITGRRRRRLHPRSHLCLLTLLVKGEGKKRAGRKEMRNGGYWNELMAKGGRFSEFNQRG